MRHFIRILLALFLGLLFGWLTSCEPSQPKQVRFELTQGNGDVIISRGNLITDFADCRQGWGINTQYEMGKVYSITASKCKVSIYLDNHLQVTADSIAILK